VTSVQLHRRRRGTISSSCSGNNERTTTQLHLHRPCVLPSVRQKFHDFCHAEIPSRAVVARTHLQRRGRISETTLPRSLPAADRQILHLPTTPGNGATNCLRQAALASLLLFSRVLGTETHAFSRRGLDWTVLRRPLSMSSVSQTTRIKHLLRANHHGFRQRSI